ncbi:class I SAM-dependent methyltransferase [Lapidilactobacillus bayanensis]|uniref:class I SAM-dependent methyltransferase n=1 Tax=Lapidilactobacillus bayanensis TaxID=2485998 RepID=UPI000F7709D1|nr:class I SAM-dependent methyltransferase [Lapidilactobacillus bayanensis]
MDPKKIQSSYELVDQAVTLLQQALKSDYLSALSETLDNLRRHDIHVENGAPTPATVQELNQLYQQIDLLKLSKVDLLSLFQLLLVRVQKVDRLNTNLQATPSSIGLVLSLLINIFKADRTQPLVIADPVIGTGNLLFNIVHQFAFERRRLSLFGIDNNDDLLALAAVFAEYLHLDVTLMHQDALTPWLLPARTDVVVADLPVGYYPVDSRAEKFDLQAKSGHSFAHYLLIEQSMTTLAAGGLGLFIVPANLFEQSEATDLLHWATTKVYLQGLLSLPKDVFQDNSAQKAILVLQNHGGTAQQAKNVMIANVPDLNNITGLRDFAGKLQGWASENHI